MNDEQILEAVIGIHNRRIEAFGEYADKHPGHTSKAILQALEDATTPEDIETLHEARNRLDDFSKAILDVYVDVWRGFGRYRCSVCGMTAKQSRDAGYDCARGC